MLEVHGNLSFKDCSAKLDGECLFMNQKSTLLQLGVLTFSGCEAKQGVGGGLMIAPNSLVQLSAGHMAFYHCTAKQGGGFKMKRGKLLATGGRLDVIDCHAGIGGGGSMASAELGFDGGTWKFQGCTARLTGGGLAMSGAQKKKLTAGEWNFVNCTAKSGGGVEHHIKLVAALILYDHCLHFQYTVIPMEIESE